MKLEAIGRSDPSLINYIHADSIIIKTIRTVTDSNTCVFFDNKKNCCSIYENRPFDCRMFPFDIICISGEYFWIIYTCNSNSDWSWTEEHLKKLEDDIQFREILNEIEVFRLITRNHVSNNESAYAVLRKVDTNHILS